MANANLYSLIAAAAVQAGDRPLLIENGKVTLSYSDLDRETARIAARLEELGGKPGDRIAVQVEKSREGVLLYLAALRAGIVFVPLNTGYTSAEIGYFLGDAKPLRWSAIPLRRRRSGPRPRRRAWPMC